MEAYQKRMKQFGENIMTEEMNLEEVIEHFKQVAKDCPSVTFHVVDLDNYEEQNKEEMIHAYIVIPQWSIRPTKGVNTAGVVPEKSKKKEGRFDDLEVV
jgi:hypothetical protein